MLLCENKGVTFSWHKMAARLCLVVRFQDGIRITSLRWDQTSHNQRNTLLSHEVVVDGYTRASDRGNQRRKWRDLVHIQSWRTRVLLLSQVPQNHHWYAGMPPREAILWFWREPCLQRMEDVNTIGYDHGQCQKKWASVQICPPLWAALATWQLCSTSKDQKRKAAFDALKVMLSCEMFQLIDVGNERRKKDRVLLICYLITVYAVSIHTPFSYFLQCIQLENDTCNHSFPTLEEDLEELWTYWNWGYRPPTPQHILMYSISILFMWWMLVIACFLVWGQWV